MIAGFTFSWGAGNRDFWLFKLNDVGQILWSCTQGDAGYQEAYNVIQIGANKYVMVGWTDPPGQPNLISKAQYDFYIVELTPRQSSNNPTTIQILAYLLSAVIILLAASLVIVDLRNRKIASKIQPQSHLAEISEKKVK